MKIIEKIHLLLFKKKVINYFKDKLPEWCIKELKEASLHFYKIIVDGKWDWKNDIDPSTLPYFIDEFS